MVYDVLKSGLNDSLQASWFALPKIDTMTWQTLTGTWLADNNYGDMFLNFLMHKDLQWYCGIDLTQLFPKLIEEGNDCVLICWLQNAMGLKLLPYHCVQGALRAKQIVKGNRRDPKNTFQLDHIEENLPCSKIYNASRPLSLKVQKAGDVASDIVQYVDSACTLALCFTSCVSYLTTLLYCQELYFSQKENYNIKVLLTCKSTQSVICFTHKQLNGR